MGFVSGCVGTFAAFVCSEVKVPFAIPDGYTMMVAEGASSSKRMVVFFREKRIAGDNSYSK